MPFQLAVEHWFWLPTASYINEDKQIHMNRLLAETTQQLYLCGIHGIISLIHSKNADFQNIQLNIAIHKIYLNIRCISQFMWTFHWNIEFFF